MSIEVNFDGLIGPTHNYSGLSPGNLASASHALQVSQPKAAALQGLEKMRTLHKLGYRQGFLLPQLRPDLSVLQRLGFSGSPEAMVKAAAIEAPMVLNLVYSASSMWAANASTVTPSADSTDGRLHLTPANLVTTAHRAIEHQQTRKCLQQIFADEQKFIVHQALPSHSVYGDEGAANHGRLCTTHGEPGVGLFVHGDGPTLPKAFPARQTRLASEAVARQHGARNTVFLQQNPAAIDAGAFHNDVVAVANGPVLFHHEFAYEDVYLDQARQSISAKVAGFQTIGVPASEVSLEEAIRSYLFNSQLLSQPDGSMDRMRLVAPLECKESEAVRTYLNKLTSDTSQPIRDVVYVDVRESMSNGGGPACLRLRVALTDAELASVDQRFLVNDSVLDQLGGWVDEYYRDELHPSDLKDPALMQECFAALTALQVLLGLGDYYL